jgi:hypothetical protein
MKKLLVLLFSVASIGMVAAQSGEQYALKRIGQKVVLDSIATAYANGCGCYVMDTTFHLGMNASNKITAHRGGRLKGDGSGYDLTKTGNGTEVVNGNAWTVNGTQITLKSSECYYLPGVVHLDSGIRLNIPAGVVIYGSTLTYSAFVQLPKSTVMAKGTASAPIVFTSAKAVRKRGDWAGIVISGRAPIAGEVAKNGTASKSGVQSHIEGLPVTLNRYLVGGSTEADNSGQWVNVQCNYAGMNVGAAGSGNELNSFSLYGVGNATIMKGLQVFEANDDAIEIFGGSVNVQDMVIINTLDDDLDLDAGYQGTIQNVLIYRMDTASRDISRSRVAEISDANGTSNARNTFPIISNVTAFGPRGHFGKDASFGGAAKSSGITGNEWRPSVFGFSIDKTASARIYNCIVHGYDQAFNIDGENEAKNVGKWRGPEFAYNSWNLCKSDFTTTSGVTFNKDSAFPYDNVNNWGLYYQEGNYKGKTDNVKNLGYNVTTTQGSIPAISAITFYSTFAKDYGNLAYAFNKFGSGFGSNKTLDSALKSTFKVFANRGVKNSTLGGFSDLDPTDDYCSVSTPFGGDNSDKSNDLSMNIAETSLIALGSVEGAINAKIDGAKSNEMYDVQIYDMSGKLVRSTKSTGNTFELNGFQTGLYTVLVSGASFEDSVKVFVK